MEFVPCALSSTMGLLNIVSVAFLGVIQTCLLPSSCTLILLFQLGLFLFAIGWPVSHKLDNGTGVGYRRYIYIGTWICVIGMAVCQV